MSTPLYQFFYIELISPSTHPGNLRFQKSENSLLRDQGNSKRIGQSEKVMDHRGHLTPVGNYEIGVDCSSRGPR